MVLTLLDLDQIEKIVDESIENRTSGLPTKNDFYSRMDEVMTELKAIREEQALITQHTSDNSDRIENLEKSLPN